MTWLIERVSSIGWSCLRVTSFPLSSHFSNRDLEYRNILNHLWKQITKIVRVNVVMFHATLYYFHYAYDMQGFIYLCDCGKCRTILQNVAQLLARMRPSCRTGFWRNAPMVSFIYFMCPFFRIWVCCYSVVGNNNCFQDCTVLDLLTFCIVFILSMH